MNKSRPFWHSFHHQISKKTQRKLKARQEAKTVWFGLGMFGMVGWSVSIPILIGIAIGSWIDKHFASPYSWTLMFLFIGVVVGCFNAWYWISKESKIK
ncbi:MAG: ATP synthase subunit [Gloeocapsa sp. DLM2.Bin57]|nr:MAG: ATP synthase subunit [Gloeocapsa sp. DLM2.Bin57]